MSKDRVHFNMPNETWEGTHATRTAALFALGMTSNEVTLAMREGARIVCRPSQFARFLIKRNEAGGRNGFKMLNAELVTPPEELCVVDVSKRPAAQ